MNYRLTDEEKELVCSKPLPLETTKEEVGFTIPILGTRDS